MYCVSDTSPPNYIYGCIALWNCVVTTYNTCLYMLTHTLYVLQELQHMQHTMDRDKMYKHVPSYSFYLWLLQAWSYFPWSVEECGQQYNFMHSKTHVTTCIIPLKRTSFSSYDTSRRLLMRLQLLSLAAPPQQQQLFQSQLEGLQMYNNYHLDHMIMLIAEMQRKFILLKIQGYRSYYTTCTCMSCTVMIILVFGPT